MKNKLIKNGHKKFYYRFRNVSLGCLVAIAVAGLVALPISISYQNELLTKAAEESSKVELDSEASSSSEVLEYVESK